MRILLHIVVLLLAGATAADASCEILSVPIAADTSQSVRDTAVVSPTESHWRPGPFDMVTNLPGDWVRWTKETFTAEQLPVIAGITALTAVTILTDRESWQATKKPYDNSTAFRKSNDVFAYLGDGKIQFGIAAAYAAYGFAFDDDRALRTASQTFEVIIACGAVVQLLKHVTGRESPFVATTSTGAWRFFPSQIEYAKHVPHYDAFPSGHIATSLATLQVIIENYPDQKWIPYVGYPIIAGIATGLVATSIHWWSDIPLGVALGYSFGRLVSHPTKTVADADPAGKTKTDVGVSFLRDGSPALALTVRW
jgi:membrane-associated phospholipid phosphatase